MNDAQRLRELLERKDLLALRTQEVVTATAQVREQIEKYIREAYRLLDLLSFPAQRRFRE
jgi:hypothetical protein